jgi:hypothetical protein
MIFISGILLFTFDRLVNLNNMLKKINISSIQKGFINCFQENI